jgi:hypothetical protein
MPKKESRLTAVKDDYTLWLAAQRKDRKYRFKTHPLTADDVRVAKTLTQLGFPHHRIASLFDLNGGRPSELKTGKKWAHIKPYKLVIQEEETSK